MAHGLALGLVLLVYYSMLQRVGVEVKARVTGEDRVNTTTSIAGTYNRKIFIDDEKAMLIPTNVPRYIRGG